MDILIKQGKAFYWGTSEWSAADIMAADGIARRYDLTPPSMEQPQYNMFVRDRFEKEYAPLYAQLGYGATIWSPLASGLLTGKYNDGIPAGTRAALPGYEWLRDAVIKPERIEKVKQLAPIAADLGCTLAQMALAWLFTQPFVTAPIVGANTVAQLEESLGAVGLRLTEDEMLRLDELTGVDRNWFRR